VSLSSLIAQLRLPFTAVREPAQPTVTIGDHTYAVTIARHRRARRYVLRMADDDTLRLTVPRGASITGGLRFAARQRSWVERERLRTRARLAPWGHGTLVRFRGVLEPLRVSGLDVACGTETIRARPADTDARKAVETHLMALAKRELSDRCLALARQSGFTVTRVSIRNPRSRWGSCSSTGVVMLNWRLVQMPPSVSDYVIFHEIAHLEQPNHSRRFWRVVARLCPEWQEAERWLRRHGKEIL
jgi:predicted metal-dependent hydrolase